MAKQKGFSKRLEPFGDLLYKLYEEVREILLQKTDDELRQVIEDTAQLTKTNIGWATYHMREIVAYEAKIILQNRAKEDTHE